MVEVRQMLVTNVYLFNRRAFNHNALCVPLLYHSLSLFHISVALRIKRGAWNEESLNRDLDLVEESIRTKRFGRGTSRTPFQRRYKQTKQLLLWCCCLFDFTHARFSSPPAARSSLSEFLLCDSVIWSVYLAFVWILSRNCVEKVTAECYKAPQSQLANKVKDFPWKKSVLFCIFDRFVCFCWNSQLSSGKLNYLQSMELEFSNFAVK